MSGIWGWFGGGAAQKSKDSPKNAILALRSQLDMLQKREKHLQNLIDEQDNIARKNVNTNKTSMFCLRFEILPSPPPRFRPSVLRPRRFRRSEGGPHVDVLHSCQGRP